MRRTLAALVLAVVLPLPLLAPAGALANVVVKNGETLSEIADRNGVSLQRLMQANGISNPNKLAVGQTLVIPGSGSSRSSSSRSSSSGSGNSITVREGDTLSGIADRAGISLNRLMQLNGISNPNKITAGDKLATGSGGYGNRPAAGTKPLPTAPYTVKKGETISELADRFRTTTDRLLTLNNIRDPNLVVAGSRIAIPGRPTGGGTGKNHVVQSGESLSDIAGRYNTSVERIVALNKIHDPNFVVEGTNLKLQAPPAPRPATRPAPRPAPKRAPKVVTKPTPKPPLKPAEAKPEAVAVKPEAVAVKPEAVAVKPEAVAVNPEPKVEVKPEAKPAAKPVVSRSRPSRSTTPASPDWRNYGPLQVDWANWQSMGGSYVAMTLNRQGQSLYLAVNCGARKLNTTNQAGKWKSWEGPQSDFEQQLVTDLCKAKGG